VSAIVLDPGYYITRTGFAGEDVPKSVTPTYYGVKNTSTGTKNLFGDNAMHDPQPHVEVRNPLTGGGDEDWVSDWDAAAELWEYAITSRLTGARKKTIRSGQAAAAVEDGDTEMKDGAENGANGASSREDGDDTENPMAVHPLLFSEPGKSTASSRHRIIELAMEDWDVPAFYLAKSGVLAAYA
jgi:actin-related protein 4